VRTIKKILCAIDLTKASPQRLRSSAQHCSYERGETLHPSPGKPPSSSLDRTGDGWLRFREGSVGEKVLRRAAWAVLIVPWDVPLRRPAR
jgi:hypothetical protein